MFILKGIVLGLVMFGIGAIVYIVFALRADMAGSEARAIGLSVIRYMTIYNPYFWAALVACLVLGCAMVATWPARITS